MNKSALIPICCGANAVWSDSVPGKEYWFCRECKNEVIAPLEIIPSKQVALSEGAAGHVWNTNTDTCITCGMTAVKFKALGVDCLSYFMYGLPARSM